MFKMVMRERARYPLPRERFSPSTQNCQSALCAQTSALEQITESNGPFSLGNVDSSLSVILKFRISSVHNDLQQHGV